uniref:F-box domain-containing protein n=1 Tax=Caenorhabditis tropicalis TaxID=1561998 RepID=A0A1I7V519_9PELO
MKAEPDLLTLPNEVLLQVFRRLPRHDVFFGVAHVNHRFRNLVQKNLKTIRLFDAHCHVNIVDNSSFTKYRNDGTDPIITYSFTLFDRRLPEFTQKRRLCLRGNDIRYKELHLSHFNDSSMHAQFERAGAGHDVSILPITVKTLLSYINLQAIRFQVRKQCKSESKRIEDDFFADCLQFCEKVCSQVEIKSLLLASKSILFPWKLGQKSLMKLSELRSIQNLILENMTTFDPFSMYLKLPTTNLASLQFRMDHRHRLDLDQMTFTPINGSLLKILSDSAVPRLDFSAYSEVSQIVSSIDSVDMCCFIKRWHSSIKPWIIKGISFNSTVTIDDFRSAVYKSLPYEVKRAAPYILFSYSDPTSPFQFHIVVSKQLIKNQET